MTAARDVAVVGAGPAGLAAAWRLSSGGARVTLYERQPSAGGRLQTDELEGVRLDPAVQLLGSHYAETLALARALGGSQLLARAPGRDALWRKGRLHALTYGSMASMATSRALPAGLKLRLATRYVPFLARHAAELDPRRPVGLAGTAHDRESIAAWGRRELGEDFVELLTYPLLAAYYGSTPEATAAGFYHTLARAGLDVSVYAVKGGMAELAAAWLRALEARGVRFVGGQVVERVSAADGGVELRTADAASAHDAAILAVPAGAALAITELEPPLREWLAALVAPPSASLALVLDRSLDLDVFGISVPRTTPPGDVLAAVCVQSGKAGGLVPKSAEALVAFPAPAVAAALAADEPEAALERMLPAIETVLPAVRGRVRRAKLYRFEEGGTGFPPGRAAHLARFEAAWLPPRLALAGAHLVGPTVEGAVSSGIRAAERLLGA